jgi:hypothetical protein
VRQEVRRLDSADCAFHQSTEFLALLVSDGSVQVLNLDQPFADEHDLGDLRSSTHPGVADELGIQYASLAGNAGNEEKLAAGLQPADGLLPALHAHDGGNSGHRGDLYLLQLLRERVF